MREWNNFTNKPKSFKFFISGKELSWKCINVTIIWINTVKFFPIFQNCPIQCKLIHCYLDLSTSEDNIHLWLNRLPTMFSNLSNNAFESCNIYLGEIHDEHLTNWNFNGLFIPGTLLLMWLKTRHYLLINWSLFSLGILRFFNNVLVAVINLSYAYTVVVKTNGRQLLVLVISVCIQYHIQGTFGAGIQVWEPKNLSSNLLNSCFLIKQSQGLT